MIGDRASHPDDHHHTTPGGTEKHQQTNIMIKLGDAALTPGPAAVAATWSGSRACTAPTSLTVRAL